MRRELGFTILEAVVVMTVMAVVTIAVPSFYHWFKMQGAGLAAEQLRADLQQARIMAISRRQTCTLHLNQPMANQYRNSWNNRVVCLSGHRGNVGFLTTGPDGRAMAQRVSFNRQGMSVSAVPVDLFLADEQGHAVYRVRVLGPGGIQVFRWNGHAWH